MPELWEAVTRHRAFLDAGGELEHRRRRRQADELREIVQRRLDRRVESVIGGPSFDDLVAAVAARRLDPWAAADALLSSIDLAAEGEG